MNKYKALIVDFDGTLVGLDFKPSTKVIKAVTELIDRNFIVSIATGRTYQGMVKVVCEKLHLQAPQIVKGGAEIIDPKLDKILWVEYLPLEEAESIIKFLLLHNYHFSVESGEYVFTLNGEEIKGYGPGVIFKDIKQLDYKEVSKMKVQDISLLQVLKNKYPNLNIIVGGLQVKQVLDITSKKATKHLAILELSKILNINPKEMIGVGDGYNDYPLLSACGLKVAMENAPVELKEIADLIVPSVEQDGLALVIDQILQGFVYRD